MQKPRPLAGQNKHALIERERESSRGKLTGAESNISPGVLLLISRAYALNTH